MELCRISIIIIIIIIEFLTSQLWLGNIHLSWDVVINIIIIIIIVVVQESKQADGVCKKGVIKQGVWVCGVESKRILQKIT